MDQSYAVISLSQGAGIIAFQIVVVHDEAAAAALLLKQRVFSPSGSHPWLSLESNILSLALSGKQVTIYN